MKFYLSNALNLIILVGILLMSVIFYSCKSSKQIKKEMVSEASYNKSYGGQGRSRLINFEIILSENIEDEETEFWLQLKTAKVKLRKYNVDNHYVLKGQFTEHKKSRELPWKKEGNPFSEIPFSNVQLKIVNQESTKSIHIKTMKSKDTVYHP